MATVNYLTVPRYQTFLSPADTTQATIQQGGRVSLLSHATEDVVNIRIEYPIISNSELETVRTFVNNNGDNKIRLVAADGSVYYGHFESRVIKFSHLGGTSYTARVGLLASKDTGLLPPYNLMLSATAGEPLKYTLTWRPIDDAAKYVVDEGGTETEVTTGESFTRATDGTSGDVVLLKVRAVDALNNSGPWSDTLRWVFPAAPAKPPNPSALALTTSVLIGISLPDGVDAETITATQLRYKATSDTTWTTFTGTITDYTATVENLTSGTQYDFQVRVQNAVGWSEWSNTVTGTPEASLTGDGTAANPYVIASPNGYDSNIRPLLDRTGTGVTSARYFRFTVGNGLAGSWTTRIRSDPVTVDWDLSEDDGTPASRGGDGDEQLTLSFNEGDMWTFRVWAHDDAAARAQVVRLRISRAAPSVPNKPVLTVNAGLLSASLSWAEPTSATTITGYRYRHRPTSQTTWTTVQTSDRSATVAGLTGQSYTFQVAAQNSGGWSEWSDAVTATPTTGAVPTVRMTRVVIDNNNYDFHYEAVTSVGSNLQDAILGIRADAATFTAISSNTIINRDDVTATDTTLNGFIRFTTAEIVAIWNQLSRFSQLNTGGTAELPDGNTSSSAYGMWCYLRGRNDTGWGPTSEPFVIWGYPPSLDYSLSPPSRIRGTYSTSLAEAAFTTGTVPGVPTLSTTVGYRQASLSWNAPASNNLTIRQYRYRYKLSTVTNYADADTHYLTGRSATITGLSGTTGTVWNVQVAAYNNAGWSDWSTATNVTPSQEQVPNAPVFTATQLTNTSIRLDWTAPDGNGNAVTNYAYRYKRSTQGDGSYTNTETTDTTATITGLTAGATYNFLMFAQNSVGWSASSAQVNLVLVTIVAPTATIADNGSGNDTFNLRVTVGTNNGTVDNYRFRYKRTDTNTWKTPGTTHSPSTSNDFSVTRANLVTSGVTLAQTATLDFQGAAHNQAGWGGWSPTVQVTSENVAVPDAPGGFSVTEATNTSATLSWNEPHDYGAAIDKYEYGYKLDSATTWTNSEITNRSATVTGLTSGQTYNFRVRAHNSEGWGSFTATEDLTLSAPTQNRARPPAPTGLSLTNNSHTSVTLTWNEPTANPAVSNYAYNYKENSATQWTNVETTSTSATITGLTASTLYNFRVAAYNDEGWGAWSTTTNHTTQAAPSAQASRPDAPVLTATQLTDTSVRLSWTEPDNNGAAITNYSWAHKLSSATTWSDNNTTSRTADVTGLTTGETYNFRAVAFNSEGWGPWSATVNVTLTISVTVVAPTVSGADNNSGNGTYRFNVTVDSNNGTIDNYRFRYKRTDNNAWKTPGTTHSPSTSSSFSVAQSDLVTTGITSAQANSLDFQVAAHNEAGWGEWSSEFTIHATATVPLKSTNVRVDNYLTTTTISIEWDNASGGASAYTSRQYAYRVDGTTTWTTVTQQRSEFSRQNITLTVVEGTSYDFRVRFSNAVGNGEWSDIFEFTAWRLPEFETPTITESSRSGTTLLLDVRAARVTGAGHGGAVKRYRIRWKIDGATTWSPSDTGHATRTYPISIGGSTSMSRIQLQVQGRVHITGYGPWSPELDHTF